MSVPNKILHVPFIKMSAAGNDFVLIDETRHAVKIAGYGNLAKKVCDRHYGIGADGLLIYKHHAILHFEMDYYNADGSTGGMCGNGARCISAYHFDVYGKGTKSVDFIAFGHQYSASTDGDTISIRMKDPTHLLRNLSINIVGDTINCYFIDTGSPHVIVFMDDLEQTFPEITFDNFDIKHIGGSIRRHEAFKPMGTNVNFVKPLSDTAIRVRTYERGVEGETLACGTGAVASAAVTAVRFNNRPPVSVHTRSGEVLTVDFSIDVTDKNIYDVTLTGTWLYHYTGSVFIDKNSDITGVMHLPENIAKGIHSFTLQKGE